MQKPNLFAAIVPIAGFGSPKDAKLIASIPTWAFHGDKDNITSVEYTRNMVNAIKKVNPSAPIEYTEVKDGGHAHSWLNTFKDKDLFVGMAH